MMIENAKAQTLAHHPSPHRDRVAVPLLLFGLALGPVAWGLQLVVNYSLAVQPCFFAGAARTSVMPGSQSCGAILAINLIAAVLALIGAAVSWRNWGAVHNEYPGSTGHALEAGEGRTRFLALCGMMTGLGFFAAIVFDTIALSMVPQCAG
jgi:hypothetical protein